MTRGEGTTSEAGAQDFRVPRVLRAAEVLCADGGRIRGRMFLPATAQSHPGAMRAEEWMNDPARFFPFLPDGEGSPVILNKAEIVVLTVAAAADQDDTLDQVPAPTRRVIVDCGGVRLQGVVVIDMPANHSRVLDLLNRPGAFLTLRDGDHHHLVHKSRITRVSEAREPARAD
jgi:peptidoglycan/xylan/chitin deacetylase (PgdA/CDA1 family)